MTPGSATAAGRPVHPGIVDFSVDPLKRQLYSQEPFFRESMADLTAVLGERAGATVLRHGLLVIKPDGYTLGCTSTAVSYLAGHGFEPVAATLIDFSPTLWRTVWLYQLSQASLDRVTLNDLVMAGRGLLLLMRQQRADVLPAAVRMSGLKGPAVPERQAEDCLRRAIRQPNRIFSLIHSADEPADVVRELGILLTGYERRRFASAMAGGRPSAETVELLRATEVNDRSPQRCFDAAASRARVVDAVSVGLAPPHPRACREGLVRGLAGLRGEAGLAFTAFRAAIEDAGIAVDPWDLAVAGSELIETEDPGTAKIIDNHGPWAWLPLDTASPR